MAGTTKLKLYNGALQLLGESALSALTDAVKARYVLDNVYDQQVEYCLGMGFWTFATRAEELNYNPAVSPAFHYTYGFTLPTDMVRLGAVFSDSSEAITLTEYAIEQGYIYANINPLYVQFVSNNASYGLDLSKWPMWFVEYVQAQLAATICLAVNGNADKAVASRKYAMDQERNAKNKDVMQKPPRFPPTGQWLTSRISGWRSSSLRGTGRGL